MSRCSRVRAGVAAFLVAILTALAVNAPPAVAQEPGSGNQDGTVGADAGGAAESDPAGAPTPFLSISLKGGYVAAGVGLRNRGSGTITLTGIPAGATVHAAYLYWSVLGGGTEPANFKQGTFKGVTVSGTKVGSGSAPCWSNVTTGYAYRANVTRQVTGNGNYALSGFASGRTNGADPWSTTTIPPLAEGASLVVLYTKSTYPITRVVLSNGYGYVANSTGLTTSIPFGFAATNPVGEVRTTFIGADGQNNAGEPPSTVNGLPVTKADWDGTDPPKPGFANGNLWDTDTQQLRNFVKPGQTSASIKVAGGPDCLAWVAQVFSIGRNGKLDTDGDALLDGWEANGYDANNDGVSDVDLPAWGASVVRKDLFVEMDYMGSASACPCYLPQAADLDRIVAVFAGAPLANNPSGQTGIALHLDAGSARGAKYNLGGGNQVPFDADLNPALPQFNAIMSANFNPRRAKIFYYMIWAHGYGGGNSSGNAFNIPNDRFVVTLGGASGFGTPDQKIGTFIHEFGHDLGQYHGGTTDERNFKPNYLSVMNYAFQFGGVPRVGAAPYFGYSSATLPTLNENALNENVGLNSPGAHQFRTRWFCPDGTGALSPGTAYGPIDWNCNGTRGGTVSVDLNGDGARNTLPGYNNWGNLVYGGGTVGAGEDINVASVSPEHLVELTWDQMR